MRFLRHLGAATAVVGIVVVLGLAWAHFGPQTLAPGPQIGFRQEIVTGPGVGDSARDGSGGTRNARRRKIRTRGNPDRPERADSDPGQAI